MWTPAARLRLRRPELGSFLDFLDVGRVAAVVEGFMTPDLRVDQVAESDLNAARGKHICAQRVEHVPPAGLLLEHLIIVWRGNGDCQGARADKVHLKIASHA